MPMVRAMRLLNSVEAGTVDSSQLTTLLADSGRVAELYTLTGMRGQMRRMASSSTTMSTFIACTAALNIITNTATARNVIGTSGTAYNLISGSSAALAKYLIGIAGLNPADYADLAAVAASSTAMAAIAASSMAMTIIAGISIAKMAMYNSDTALNAIAASSTAMAMLRAAAQYAVKSATENGTTSVSLSSVMTGAQYIILGYSRNTTQVATATISTKRSGSAISASMTSAGANSAIAQDVNCAIPVTSPYSFVLGGTGTITSYFGTLRCDV